MKPNVAVVVLNYNGTHFLRQFLPSLIAHTPQARLIMVDNASTDDSVDLVQSAFPTIEIIRLPTNKGFCGGYNTALQQIAADYFVLLNSDVEVTPGWLAPIIGIMEHDPTIAAAQPKILSFNTPDFFEYAGAGGGYIDALGYPFCRGRIFDKIEKDRGQYDDVCDVFWCSGACLCLRATCFFDMGGLNERFFAHMEEIDLCWKLKRKGYRNVYYGRSVVRHVGGGTLPTKHPKKIFLNFRNSLSVLYCHSAPAVVGYKIIIRLLLDGMAGLRMLLQGEARGALMIVKAHWEFFGQFATEQKERHFWRKKLSNFTISHQYPRSIVWDFFVKNRKTTEELPGFSKNAKNPKSDSVDGNSV